MSTTSGTPDKPSLNRRKLAIHRIFYEKDICWRDGQDESKIACRLRESYPHVEALRKALLNFGNVMPDDGQSLLQEEYRKFTSDWSADEKASKEKWSLLPPQSAFWSSQDFPSKCEEERRVSATNEMRICKNIAHFACKRTHNAEVGWTSFLQKHFFTEFEDLDKSRTLYETLFDEFTIQQDVSWNEHGRRTENDVTLTGPKPDLTYAFPISKQSDTLLPGFAELDLVQNFSYKTLKELRRTDGTNLKSTLTTGLHNARDSANGDGLRDPDRMCFPWAVVEVKRSNAKPNPEEFCYCQAVNALTTAHGIHEALYFKAFGFVPRDIPPLVGFTSIGPELKVWLLYLERELSAKKHRMVCIWATNLQLTWGVYSTRLIIQNMHIWASRMLRPRVSSCLSLLISKAKFDMSNDRAMTPENEVRLSPVDKTPCPSSTDPQSSSDVESRPASASSNNLGPGIEEARFVPNARNDTCDDAETSDLDLDFARLNVNCDSTKDSQRTSDTNDATPHNTKSVPSMSWHDLMQRVRIDAISRLKDPTYFRRNDLIIPGSLAEAIGDDAYDIESEIADWKTVSSSEPYHEEPERYKYHEYTAADDCVRYQICEPSTDEGDDENYRTPISHNSDEELSEEYETDWFGISESEEDDLTDHNDLRGAHDDKVSGRDETHKDVNQGGTSDSEDEHAQTATENYDGYEADESLTESGEEDDEEAINHPREESRRDATCETLDDDDDASQRESSINATSQACEDDDQQPSTNVGEVLTWVDVERLAWIVLEALEGSEFTELQIFQSAVERLSDTSLYNLICYIVFVRDASDIIPQLRPEYARETWEDGTADRLEKVCGKLSTALQLPGSTRFVVTMGNGLAQSFLVRHALRLLLEHAKSHELRQILTAILSVQPGYWLVNFLCDSKFPVKASEWCELKEIALGKVTWANYEE